MKRRMRSRRRSRMGIDIVKRLWWCGAKSPCVGLAAQGHVRVNVGRDKECMLEMELQAHFLNHPLLEDLLQLSEQEFGYSYKGALRIACDVSLFLYILHLLETRNPSAHYLDLPHLLSVFYTESSSSSLFLLPSS